LPHEGRRLAYHKGNRGGHSKAIRIPVGARFFVHEVINGQRGNSAAKQETGNNQLEFQRAGVERSLPSMTGKMSTGYPEIATRPEVNLRRVAKEQNNENSRLLRTFRIPRVLSGRLFPRWPARFRLQLLQGLHLRLRRPRPRGWKSLPLRALLLQPLLLPQCSSGSTCSPPR
jgi:hypothetical protein